jgi:hypothetical protein
MSPLREQPNVMNSAATINITVQPVRSRIFFSCRGRYCDICVN